MAELSKIKTDDEGGFYIVPVSEEKEFDEILFKDPADLTAEEWKILYSRQIQGDYESVHFMWPVEINEMEAS